MAFNVSEFVCKYLDMSSNKYFKQIDNENVIDCSFFDTSAIHYRLLKLPEDHPVHIGSSFFSIIFCEGYASVLVGDQEIFCFPGNILLFRNNCNFRVKAINGGQVHYAMFKEEMFNSLFFTDIADCPIIYDFFQLEDSRDEFLYFDCDDNMEICQFSKNLQSVMCHENNRDDKMVRCALVLFLTGLHQIHTKNLVINESSMMKDYLIGSILKYMADHCDTATLSKTAAHFNYHPAYFSSLFHKKAYTCFSIKLQQIRLEQARKYLISTSMTMEQICEKIGFREKSHFYRCFKSTYGITPGQFRNKYNHKGQ